MKRISILSLICAAIVLGACTRDIAENREEYDPAAPVRFITNNTATADKGEAEDVEGAATRGTPITSVSQMTSMGVFASATGTSDWSTSATPNKMFNQKLNYSTSTGEWQYVGREVKWEATSMADRYSFFAYAPYAASGNGISVTSSASTAGVPTLTYTVPTRVQNQPDLMVAVPRKNMRPRSSSVALDMKHALTSVAFQIKGNGEKVKGIAIKGVSVSGTLAVTGETITWSSLGAVTSTDFSASLNYDTTGAGAGVYYTTTSTMSTNLIASSGYLMMIPQTLVAGAKVVVTYSDDTTIELALSAQTWAAGQKLTYNITLEEAGGGAIECGDADILYFASSIHAHGDYRLSVGKWDDDFYGTSSMVFTKFGSVVGFSSTGGLSIGFNPSSSSYSYASIPTFTGTSTSTSVSSSSYHNGTNIKAGKGDICKLAGLSSWEVKTMTVTQLNAYESGWRLPTLGENRMFVGLESTDSSMPGPADGSDEYTYTVFDADQYEPNTGSFPYNPYYYYYDEGDKNTVTLPAAGMRNTSGSTTDIGTGGAYWSSTAYDSSKGYFMDFNSSYVYPTDYCDYGHGIAIRCVPTGETPTPSLFVSPATCDFYPEGEFEYIYVSKVNFRNTPTVTTSAIDNTTKAPASWLAISGSGISASPNTTGATRTATITFTATSTAGETATATMTVSQDAIEGGAYILYIGSDGRLTVGRWYDDITSIEDVVYTQFGSVIGFDTSSITFNPTSTNDYSYSYTSIPNFNASVSTSVSSAAYHNGTNIKAGRGDICQLVGLSSTQAKAMTAAQFNGYHSGWRLPTRQENIDFVGRDDTSEDNTQYSGDYYYYYEIYDGDSYNPNLGYFPMGTSNYASLPAAGSRGTSGSASGQGDTGYYWSSTASGTSSGYLLYFDSGYAYPSDNFNKTYGLAVRCVPAGVTPTPLITVSSTGYTYPKSGGNSYFTVYKTNFKGTPTVSVIDDKTGNTASWLTAAWSSTSNTSSSLTVTAAANNGVGRSATITLTATTESGTSTATIKVSQEGGKAFILYFDNERLTVGQWGSDISWVDELVYTKFGSVIGFDGYDSWSSNNNIRFNPMSSTPSNYAAIPYSTSSIAHSGTNIKSAGLGDICQLAGLTSEEAKAMTAAQFDSYQSGWRLPTNQENIDFVGRGGQSDNGVSYSSNVYYNWDANSGTVSDPGVGIFSMGTALGASLPAAGYRNSGSLSSQGSLGLYWSSTALNGSYGYSMEFDSSSVSLTNSTNTFGLTNRCVSTGSTPSPVAIVSPKSATFAGAGETKTFTLTAVNADIYEDEPTILRRNSSGNVATWITVSPDWGNGELEITTAANTTGASRTGTVEITVTNDNGNNSADATISITQTAAEAAPVITVSPTTATFMSSGETQTFTVSRANYSSTPTVSSKIDNATKGTAAWITNATMSGTTLTVTTAANSSTSSRTATITLTATNTGGTDTATVEITQSGATPAPVITVSPTSYTFAAAGESKDFTISKTNYTGTPTLSWSGGSKPSWITTASVSGNTLTVTAAANNSGARSATLTLTATNTGGTSTATVTVSQYLSDGGEGDILYFGAGNRLSVGKWDNSTVTLSNMVYTMFGSVIGFTGVGAWDNDNTGPFIKFNPTGTAIYYRGTMPHSTSSITHSGTNVKAGRGDICKLVGLTSAEAQAMTATELDDYESGWRLPTDQENRLFVGLEPDDLNATPETGSAYYTFTSGYPGIGTFPKNKYAPDVILPAAGFRDNGVTFGNGQIGTQGAYWSSNSYPLYFSTYVQTSLSLIITSTDGLAIRCVPTGKAQPRISVSPTTTATFSPTGETKTFTVSTINFTGTPSVTKIDNATGSTASWITASVNGSTLTITAAANSGAARTATITLSATNAHGTSTRNVAVTQYINDACEDNAGILYFGSGNRLSIGSWDNSTITISNMVFAQFGSVIGFTTGSANSEAWDNSHIKFNPMSTIPASYTSIPNFTGTDVSTSVSSSIYHTGSNIKAGKGDICKLAGLTSAEAEAMTNAKLKAYDSGWRLPTEQENIDFIGQNDVSYAGDGYYNCDNNSRTALDPAISTFPQGTAAGASLPAAGYRSTNGLVSNMGRTGYYWSSTAYDIDYGYHMLFTSSTEDANVYPSDSNYITRGHAVRCVPNN